MDLPKFRSATADLGLDLSQEQSDAFEAFEQDLYRANEFMNLTRVPREECWRKHFIDSLLFQDLIPPGSSVLDIGTGPGFPAWPLAVARPDLRIVAIDSNGKMLGFLGQHALPNLTTILGRIEDEGIREKFGIVTGRAIAPLPIQLEVSAAPCEIGGLVIPMRTKNDVFPLRAPNDLGLKLERVCERQLPGGDEVRVFPIYKKVSATPIRFPRPWVEIKRRPLA